MTYAIAGQTVAVRVTGDPDPANNGLHTLYADHLGSISAIQQANGTVQQTRYLPFGGYRAGSGPNPITSHATTSQQENMDIGLYYYNGRYYAPTLARFLSPDTLIPDPANPQSFNRYSYVENRALNYIDPSGHCLQYHDQGNQDELVACMDVWNSIADHFGQELGWGDQFPGEYMNWLMENATTEELTSYLDQLTDADNRQEQSGQWDNCIPMQGGIMNCPPEGGWPEYYPMPDGNWYIKISAGPLAYNSDKQLELGEEVIFCPGACIGGELDMQFNLQNVQDPKIDFEYIRGVGTGSTFKAGLNPHGLLVMIGRATNMSGESKDFVRATVVDVSIEIGFKYR